MKHLSIFDPHHYALSTWDFSLLTEPVLIHLDAHLDLNYWSEERLLDYKSLSKSERWDYAAEPENSTREGLYGIEDFLYPLFKDRVIQQFIWIKPPLSCYAAPLGKTLRSLSAYGEDEFLTWSVNNGYAEGILYGVPSIITNQPERVKAGENCILLDIDLDFFINHHGELWTDPLIFIKKLTKLPWFKQVKHVSVAWSTDGGYTPLKHQRVLQQVIDFFIAQSASIHQGPAQMYSNQWNDFLSKCQTEPLKLLENLNEYHSLIDEHPGEFYSKLGYLYQKDKQIEQAEHYYLKALEILPNHYYTLLNLGIMMIRKGNLKNAVALFETVQTVYPEEVQAKSLLYLSRNKLDMLTKEMFDEMAHFISNNIINSYVFRLANYLKYSFPYHQIAEKEAQLNKI